jgi:hypothetical protein
VCVYVCMYVCMYVERQRNHISWAAASESYRSQMTTLTKTVKHSEHVHFWLYECKIVTIREVVVTQRANTRSG